MTINRKVVLARRPKGLPVPSDFRVEEEAVGELPAGHVRVGVEHLSIDAFIRTILEESSYHPSVPLGVAITAFGVGHVLESNAPELAPGDAVRGSLCAQTHATLPAQKLEKVNTDRAPLTAYLGALGLTSGVTAYVGVRDVGAVKPGETFVVSGAAGGVGSLAGQIARIDGARVIGIAGGAQKLEHLVKDLGFHAAIDYKRDDVDARLRELAPEGIDVFFDNVGGEILDVVLDQIRPGARIVICGAISQYGGDVSRGVRGPSLYLRLAERNARMEGFAVNNCPDRYEEAEEALAGWLARGDIELHEHVEHGIERFGETLGMLFTGGHMGKLLLAPSGS
jgi:NADPH-dependent curcumin reductase CurA